MRLLDQSGGSFRWWGFRIEFADEIICAVRNVEFTGALIERDARGLIEPDGSGIVRETSADPR